MDEKAPLSYLVTGYLQLGDKREPFYMASCADPDLAAEACTHVIVDWYERDHDPLDKAAVQRLMQRDGEGYRSIDGVAWVKVVTVPRVEDLRGVLRFMAAVIKMRRPGIFYPDRDGDDIEQEEI